MARTPAQKREAADRRRKNQAHKEVGHFMYVWNLLEHNLGVAIRRLFDLSAMDAAIINANLNFQSKMGIVVSMINLYYREDGSDTDWEKRNKKTFNDIFDINTDWRNVVAHCYYFADEDGSINFTRVQARRELKIPEFVKTKKDFQDICERIVHLASEMDRLAKEAKRLKDDYVRRKQSRPKPSLAELSPLPAPQPPLQGLLHFLTANPETKPQTPRVPDEKEAGND